MSHVNNKPAIIIKPGYWGNHNGTFYTDSIYENIEISKTSGCLCAEGDDVCINPFHYADSKENRIWVISELEKISLMYNRGQYSAEQAIAECEKLLDETSYKSTVRWYSKNAFQSE